MCLSQDWVSSHINPENDVPNDWNLSGFVVRALRPWMALSENGIPPESLPENPYPKASDQSEQVNLPSGNLT